MGGERAGGWAGRRAGGQADGWVVLPPFLLLPPLLYVAHAVWSWEGQRMFRPGRRRQAVDWLRVHVAAGAHALQDCMSIFPSDLPLPCRRA